MSQRKKFLVIGAGTGGIGDEILDAAIESQFSPDSEEYRQFLAPAVFELDVLRIETIQNYLDRHGPFDEIVYSAGVNRLQWIKDLNAEDLARTFAINVFGLPLLAAEHLRRWPDHRVRVAVVVSDAAERAMRGSLAYCASKAALANVVKGMARELAPLWTVVGVSPGMVEDTPMTAYIEDTVPNFRGWTPEQAREYETSGSTLGRRMTKREIADTVLFALRGPESLNGTNITINGGN